MPKANHKKRNNASHSTPYAEAAAKTKAANSIFRMNTDIGQHVLKNPGIAEKIVEKADLKQSDVSLEAGMPWNVCTMTKSSFSIYRSSSK